MTEWMKAIFGDTMSPTLSYGLLFAAVIIGVIFLLWIARKLLGGTFVSGGRSRHLRLAVMDATPVDSRRRLVLVRRDDVEHLILIGGPTDLVVEQNIRLDGPPKAKPASIAPSAPAIAREPEPARPPEPPRAPEPRRMPEQPRPVPMAAPVVRQPAAPLPPVMQPRPTPQPAPNIAPSPPRAESTWAPRPPYAPAAPAPSSAPAVAAAIPAAAAVKLPEPAQASEPDIDDALLADLSESLSYDENGAPEISLEKEMESLLGSLDTKKDRIS